MKVVIFCGGQGMRMREYSERLPKPLVPIGDRPIIWHMMRYYAHFGHTEFILCLGYGAQQIKEYFMNYQEWESNDFVLRGGATDGNRVEMMGTDLDDWDITFVDTGLSSSIGERLRRVRRHIGTDEEFLCNYADCLTDCDINEIIALHRKVDATATVLTVPPTRSFHVVEMGEDSTVNRVGEVNNAGLWINGGYMVLRNEIFDVLNPDEELVYEPFARLAARGRLHAFRHQGHWIGVDTFKERQELEELWIKNQAWWAPWQHDQAT